MKILDILKTVGGGLISTLVPGGGAIVELINGFLPDDKKLPSNATGQEAESAINSLSSTDKASVLNKEIDVKIEHIKQSYGALNTMLAANAKSTHTTRPKIAYQSFQVIGFSTIAVVSAWAYAVVTKDTNMIGMIKNSWMFIFAVIAPLVTVLHAYFGVLRDETKDRFNAAQGHKVDGVSGLLGRLFKK